jgi:hypothetical protein
VAAPIPSTIRPDSGTAAGRVTARGCDYADLLRRVRAAGLLDRRRGYYVTKIAVTGGPADCGAGRLRAAGRLLAATLAVAAFLTVVFTQIGFIGHDAGHRQTLRSRGAAEPTRPPVAPAGTRVKRRDRFGRLVGGYSQAAYVTDYLAHTLALPPSAGKRRRRIAGVLVATATAALSPTDAALGAE